MKKPVIAITLDYSNKNSFSSRPWYALRKDYSDVIAKFGGVAIFLPYDLSNIDNYLKIADGLLISGGDDDINPRFYNEKSVVSNMTHNDMRAEFEITLLKEALKLGRDFPILGICNGLQVMNVVYGGSLIQDIKEQTNSVIEHRNQSYHQIKVIENTILASVLENTNTDILVNSSHHQAISRLGDGLIASAYAEDGIIEAIEDPSRLFTIGCEWHPELLDDNSLDCYIFEHFIKAAKC